MSSVCDTLENGLGKRGLDLDSISNPFFMVGQKTFCDVNFAILDRMASGLQMRGRPEQQFMA